MTNEQIIEVMKLPMSSTRVNQYFEIYQLCTNESFHGCLCGNGFNRLYTTCKNYADTLQKNINNNNKL